MKEISKEKLEWMKEVGMHEFKKPMKYYLGCNQVFSEDYIKNTSLSKLKERYEKHIDTVDFDKKLKTEKDF